MNPVFVFLVLIAAFLLWVVLSTLFKATGKFIDNVATNVKGNIEDNEIKEEKENNDKES
jgi:F0F1-type ATP synthase membrane subunit b/b'